MRPRPRPGYLAHSRVVRCLGARPVRLSATGVASTLPLLPMNKIAKLRIQSAIIQQCRCFYCGLAMIEPALPEFTPKELKPKWQKYLRCTAEHLTARQNQGRDNSQNIVAACWWCNTRRHKGRAENAPNPQKYRQRVQSLMKKGCWHPANTLAVDFHANRPQ
jgi:hypothetical protein